jgi:hypothetical protein
VVATDLATALGWGVRRLPLLALGALAAVGTVIGWVPYRLTGRVAASFPGTEASDVRATAKALVGAALFLGWTLALSARRGLVGGWLGGVRRTRRRAAAAVLALVTGEGCAGRGAMRAASRCWRGRPARIGELRQRQRALATASRRRRTAAALPAAPPRPRPCVAPRCLVRRRLTTPIERARRPHAACGRRVAPSSARACARPASTFTRESSHPPTRKKASTLTIRAGWSRWPS